MADFNQCTFTGRLAADPEVRAFGNGDPVCNLRLAVSETWKDKATGERKERTEWVSVKITSKQTVDVAQRFLTKGSKVLVQGKLQTRSWDDKDGNKKYATDVVIGPFGGVLTMLDSKGDREQRGESRERGYQSSYGPAADNVPSQPGMDDEVPF
jgi:single-strand DNA-binding protein